MPWYRPSWLARRHPVVPMIRLGGIIGSVPFRGGLTLQSIEPSLAAAFAFKHAPLVALAINSPGGSPVQSALIARRIRDLAEEKKKPVVAFVEDIAASGGYWLALAADEILVDRASIVGSIGVVSAGFGLDQAISRLGIERRLHTTGPRKALLDPFRPEQPDDVVVLEELQDDIFESFKAHLRERRGAKLKLADDELFSGRVWSGKRAVEHGLVDGFGEVRSTLKERHGQKLKIRNVTRERSWLQRRLGMRRPAGLDELAPLLLGQLEEAAIWRRYGL